MMDDRNSKWKAVTERSRAADGEFLYAVRTTRIYCRPSCPSRRPKPENVEYFPDSETARRAGYRACARCRPDEQQSNNERIISRVKEFIASNLDQTITLASISEYVGVSKFHMQRLFKAETGMTPREYANQLRIGTLKRHLKNGKGVTEAMYDSGYSSSSRLYERSTSMLGMTPGTYAAGGKNEQIGYAFIHTGAGLLLIAATKKGVCFLQFGTTEEKLLEQLQREFPAATIAQGQSKLKQWTDPLVEYLDGRTKQYSVPVALKGTQFQTLVWQHLQEIPAGETRTYSQVAEAIGKPRAVRAVANACASNRIALAVPCHRVVRQDGGLGGYRWGVELKKKLLERESE